jgi:sulfonate transport system substrate-binding protein
MLATACGSSSSSTASSSGSLNDVTITVADANNAIASELKASGQDAGTAYKVKYVSSTSTSTTLSAVRGGSVDFFGSGQLPAIFGAAGKYPFKIIGAYYRNVNATGVLVSKDSPIKTVQDLKGKSVAVNAGSNAQKVLYRALVKAGLKTTDVHLINMQPAAALPAFVSNKIDAWATFDPNTSVAEVKYQARMLVDGSNGIHSGVNYYAASDKALKNSAKSKAIGDFVQRLTKADAWAAKPADKTAYLALEEKLNGLGAAVNEKMYDRGSSSWKPITPAVIEDAQSTADEFTALGAVDKVNLTDYFDTRYNSLVSDTSSGS